MRYLDARFRLPDRLLHPMQELIRYRDVVRYEELVAWNLQPEDGVEHVLFYVEADLEPYREALREAESVREYRLAPIDGGSAHVWACEETRPEERAWRGAFEGRHLVVVPPVRFDETAAMGMTIVGHGEDIQEVLEEIPPDVDVTVNEIGTYDARAGALAVGLTDRQRGALATALDLGYYEVPREATLADVAGALDCAESTASVLLRRAERTVVARALDRYGGEARASR